MPRRGSRICTRMSNFSRENLLRMTDSLTDLVSVAEDHVVIIDIGPAESVRIKVESIGRPFRPIERTAVVV